MLVYSDLIFISLYFVLHKVFIIFFIFFGFHFVVVKNQDILNDDTSHFKLARSVLKIASFEFANLQYFNSTFMNKNCLASFECEIVVHAVFTSVIVL